MALLAVTVVAAAGNEGHTEPHHTDGNMPVPDDLAQHDMNHMDKDKDGKVDAHEVAEFFRTVSCREMSRRRRAEIRLSLPGILHAGRHQIGGLER